MDLASAQTGPLTSLLVVALTVVALSLWGRRRETLGMDLAMATGLLAWMVFLVWQARFSPQPPTRIDEFVEHMGYQLCVAAACELVLSGAQVGNRITTRAWIVQVAGGGLILLMWAGSGEDGWFRVWETINWVIVGSLLLLMLVRWPSYRREKTVPMALLSLVLLLYCLAADTWHHPTSPFVIAGMFIYPAALLALWYMVTSRMRARASVPPRAGDDALRQRIAQDVHDGIGSQLVSILASLDPDRPDQQALALSLEQCLLDLKMTVDTLSQEGPCLVEGLAMLRYRIQPSLDRLGIQLHWDIQDHPALDRLPSLSVTHALRIVQEAVANVMRHAEAKNLTVSCNLQADSARVILHVIDNGRGMPTPVRQTHGRGLSGMRRRAREAGLKLAITSLQQGTTVQLIIPAAAADPSTRQGPGPSTTMGDGGRDG